MLHGIVGPLLQAAATAAQTTAQVAKLTSQVTTATGRPLESEAAILLSNVPAAMWMCWLIQLAKNSTHLGWINQNSRTINRIASLVAAFLLSAGFNWSIQGSVLAGSEIHISIPAAGAIAHFLAIDCARSYGLQEVFYQTTLKA